MEPYGTGVNSYSYWVATDILGEWTQLPLVVPQQVKASRNLKVIFSGDLEQDIHKLAKFPGKEKHLVHLSLILVKMCDRKDNPWMSACP